MKTIPYFFNPAKGFGIIFVKQIVVYLFCCFFLLSLKPSFAVVLEKDISSIETKLAEGDLIDKLKAIRSFRTSGLPLEKIQQILLPYKTIMDMRIKNAIVLALYENGDRESYKDLLNLIKDKTEEENIRLRALQGIVSLNSKLLLKDFPELIKEEKNSTIQLALLESYFSFYSFDFSDKEILSVCKKYLQTGNRREKNQIIDLLSKEGAKSLDLIFQAMEDEDDQVVAHGSQILTQIGGALVKNMMRSYAIEETGTRRFHAAYALVALGEKSFSRYISEELISGTAEDRIKMIKFLTAKIGQKGDEPFIPIIKRIFKKDVSDKARSAAEEYLQRYAQVNH